MAITDVIAELNRMRAEGVIGSYAIGGAVGAQFYLEPASTVDVDVFVVFKGTAESLLSLRPIYNYLLQRGAKPNGPYLEIGGWPVQFLPTASPLHDEAIVNARTFDLGGMTASVLGPEYLAAIALETGRPKDKARVVEFINTGAVDLKVLQSLIDRHGLAAKWKQFQNQFLS